MDRSGDANDGDDPHGNQPLVSAGESLDTAGVAVVFVHGRGATAQGMLGLAEELPARIAALAPQAAGNTWYPNPFTAPVETNEPGRSSGLGVIGDALAAAADADIPANRVALIGFSQGACLASEFVARTPRRYGALAALSGGLIGETIDPEAYTGDLNDTPVFLGCSDHDPHIPVERIRATATLVSARVPPFR